MTCGTELHTSTAKKKRKPCSVVCGRRYTTRRAIYENVDLEGIRDQNTEIIEPGGAAEGAAGQVTENGGETADRVGREADQLEMPQDG